MKNEKTLDTLENFTKINGEDRNEVDYIHMFSSLNELPEDYFLSIVRLLAPEFKIIEGRIYINFLFHQEKYDDLSKDKSDAQYWMNLIKTDSFFENEADDLWYDKALDLANTLVKMWNFKIENECPDNIGRARVMEDDEYNEVFVTIDDYKE